MSRETKKKERVGGYIVIVLNIPYKSADTGFVDTPFLVNEDR
jgi:hypothetical protein